MEKNIVGWEEILKKINLDFEFNLGKYFERNNRYKNALFTLIYECFVIKGQGVKDKKVEEKEIREKFNLAVSKLNPNKYHKLIVNLGFKDIITTNYDYTLEKAIQKQRRYQQEIHNNQDTTLLRYHIKEQRIWHIHGDTKHSSNMVIGNQEYGRNIARMQDNIKRYIKKTSSTRDDNEKDKEYIYNIKQQEITNNVMDFFFTHDIHIIGLALDFNEQDLWWLLIKRAKNLQLLQNKIYYYVPDFEYNENLDKLDMFKEFGLITEVIKTDSIKDNEGYVIFYNELIKKVNTLVAVEDITYNEVAASI